MTSPSHVVVEQAAAAAQANQEPSTPANGAPSSQHNNHHPHHKHHHHASGDSHQDSPREEGQGRRRSTVAWIDDHLDRFDAHETPIENVPPPAYASDKYGKVDFENDGLGTEAEVTDDGRINININQKTKKLSALLAPALRTQLGLQTDTHPDPYIPPSLAGAEGEAPPPPMNIVIHVVGSRGDVQPFVALGQVLKRTYGHRVRLATHPTFKTFVEENGLEFFSIGGDPSELMAFMVKNPGLMPGMDSLKNGDIGKRRKGMYDIIVGCWRSCIEAGDGTGAVASDYDLDSRSSLDFDPTAKPFVADAIIANPPSFAHVHCAERLGIPLHLMFTMPWSPTQAFPHPLANIQSSNAEQTMSNFITYALVETLTWQGLGDVINRFREKSLKLEPVSIIWAPGMATRLRIPYTYCWSPALIPKPKDWGPHIDISGFFFLNLSSNYTPAADLQAYLDAGPPPVYIGFGSIVVDDPNAMTKLIFDAVKITGQRALVSKGWGGFGADTIGIPEGVFMLGNVPHDWLFKHVSCVVHHGGAGTTAAGISAGRPTVVVPFFGDQPFWGAMTARAGAGPPPVPYKTLTAEKLAAAIMKALEPASLDRAAELSAKIAQEKGSKVGAASFHKQLRMENLRCVLAPSRAAVWRMKRTDIRLSAFAATVLGNEGLLDFSELKLYRPCEYETDDGPWDPITGGASAIIGTIGSLVAGFSDFPVEIAKGLSKVATDAPNLQREKTHKASEGSPVASSTDLAAKSSPPSTTSLVKPEDRSVDTLDIVLSPIQSATSLPADEAPIVDADIPASQAKESELDASGQPTLQKHPSVTSVNSLNTGHRKSLREVLGGSSSPKGSTSPRNGSPSRQGSHLRHGSSNVLRNFDVAMDTGKGVSKIVGVGLKSPLDFTLSLAKGFHNAPKLYGDESVRESEKITDLQSGLKAAATEFGYGFYDGITGLLTQPVAGARKEGGAGFVKGVGKGIGGLILKPGAAVWGLPGYTAKGIYKELQKHLGSSVSNYIIASRTAQGYDEWKSASHEERIDVIARFQSPYIQSRIGKRKHGEKAGEPNQSFLAERHQSWDDRKKAFDAKRVAKRTEKDKQKEKKRREWEAKPEHEGKKRKPKPRWCPVSHFDHDLARTQTFPGTHELEPEHDEFESAIQRSITATSKGNKSEDALIERALRASVAELQSAKGEKDADEEAMDRALEASVKEAARARAESTAKMHAQDEAKHEQELKLALQKSLEEYHLSNPPTNEVHHHYHDEDSDSYSDVDPEDRENFERALAMSKEQHAEQDKAVVDAGLHDDELNKAIEESKAVHKKRGEDLEGQKTEEEIVMDYVKKQSLAEEQHKKAHMETKEVGASDDETKKAVEESGKGSVTATA